MWRWRLPGGICDLSELTGEERAELNRLYPQADPGEGWFGKKEAEYCMEHHPKAL